MSSSSGYKICKDCKHARLDLTSRIFYFVFGYEYARCNKSPIVKTHTWDARSYLVSGKKPQEHFYFCNTERMSHSKCGPEGKLWEKKL